MSRFELVTAAIQYLRFSIRNVAVLVLFTASPHIVLCTPPANQSAQAALQPTKAQGESSKEQDSSANTSYKPLDNHMENPRSFQEVEGGREIDVIVIHHISALFWSDKEFQSMFAKEIAAFEDSLGKDKPDDPKYDMRYCKQILEMYGFSAHYLIGRDGTVWQLVEDEDIAYHAGESKMLVDGRTRVNRFSIGIELVASHPKDDPAVRSKAVPGYTNHQYEALNQLLVVLCRKHSVPVKNIVGHEDVAPARKRDPGPLFDWIGVKRRLKLTLKTSKEE